MNVSKKLIIAKKIPHATTLMVHSTALVILALQEMEHIAKVVNLLQSIVSSFFCLSKLFL